MPRNNTRLVQQTRRDGYRQGYHRKGYEPVSTKPDRDALRAERAKASPGDWSTYNSAPEYVSETLWGCVTREYRAFRAHARNWVDRMAERAANNAAARRIMREQDAGDSIFRDAKRYEPRQMSDAERARFIAEGELYRKTLEWRRKTGRNMLTGEHLSGMPIDRFDEFPDGNPFGEDGELKFNRERLDVEEGRPFDPKAWDASGNYIGKRRRRTKDESDPDPRRDDHGRDVTERNLDGTFCSTGSLFGPDGREYYTGYNREQYFREVVLKGLTPEEAAAHRAEQEEHDAVLYADAKEREWAERPATRWL